jgi:hypothetical protein
MLNVALFAAVGYLATRPPVTPAPEVITQSVTTVLRESAPAPEPVPAMPAPPAVVAGFDWRQVESPDYREYIANLRKVGCPEQTIRDLIIADVSKLYAERRATLYPAPKVVRYWQSSDMQYVRDNVKYQEALKALDKEKNDLIHDLLGVDLKREIARVYGGETSYDRTLMFLPEERRGPLQDVLDRYRELERAVYAEANGDLDEAQQARVKALREEREKALTALLSPQEQKEYEMTTSRLARNIRSNLNGFEASEQEFLAIYNAKKAYEDAFGSDKQDRKNETPEQKAARVQAAQTLDAAMLAALGGDRYAEYQRSQNNGWEDLYRVVKRYDLPKESAVAVYAMRQAAEAEYRNIQGNTGLPLELRAAALQQLSAQAKQAAASALGNDAFNYYVRKNGQWLNRIGQLPKPKKSG